mgnify:CR=1 FL=1|tara:strand:+ start:9037 stop:9672 length:636 start_codon:yes stop_codon:yes gene_type:complete
MHKNIYKIKAAILCNKNFTNSINELKPFLGFDLNEINPQKDVKSINLENQVLIVDSSCYENLSFEMIKIPVILILGQKEKANIKNSFELVIKLPLSILQFNQSVVDISQKYKFDQNSIIKIKDYILDKNTRSLKRNEILAKVTEKEMYFIEELSNSPKPLTKDYILKNIWGYASDADTHTVETHIYRLRQKIKNQFNDENFIKHTKKGYSI